MKKQLLVVMCLATIVFTKSTVEVCGIEMPSEHASCYALTESTMQAKSSFDAGITTKSFKQKLDKSLAGGMPRGNEKGKRKNGRWRWNLWGKVC
jgi:hypothetical protein